MEATASSPFDGKSSRARTGRWIVRGGSIALTLLLALVWLFVFRPSALGGPATYVIVAGTSMLPALESGDLVVALEQDSYSSGDVVVYEVPRAEPGAGTKIVHRIVGRSPGGGSVVRGDNREGPDYWRPTPDEILGEMWLRVPAMGTFLVFLKTSAGVALLAAVTTFLVALGVLSGQPRSTRSG